MAIRFFNLLVISVFDLKLYAPVASLLFTVTLALVAKFQPYKNKRSNTVDIVMLTAMIFGYTSTTIHFLQYTLYPKWLNGLIVGVAILIVYCYLLYIISVRISTRAKLYLTRNKLFSKFKRMCKIKSSSGEDNQAILGHEETNNYSSCH